MLSFTTNWLLEQQERFGVRAYNHALAMAVAKDPTLDAKDYSFANVLAVRISTEFVPISVQLQAKNRDLWDSYDRLRAETLFRLNISFPIVFLSIAATLRSNNMWWLALGIVPAALTIASAFSNVRAAGTLVQAVVLKIVEPPVLQLIRASLDMDQKNLDDLTPPREGASEHRVVTSPTISKKMPASATGVEVATATLPHS